jgi:methylase of polypeptide subunit release factors
MRWSLPLSARAQALATLGNWLATQGYAFVTVTPATHSRVLRRAPGQGATSLADVFGWNMPFGPGVLPQAMLSVMQDAQLMASCADGRFKSLVRFSSVGGQLFAHSGFPTTAADSIFFGPDTYRFVELVTQALERQPLTAGARILDLCCGAGPAGILATLQCNGLATLGLADINGAALDHARANAAMAGLTGVEFAQGDLYSCVSGHFDLVVANPPYLNDGEQRLYRHGGGQWGGGLSERIVIEGLARLRPGGRLVLYTGAAIISGVDSLHASLLPVLQDSGWPWTYREVDVDVFGEELDEPAYARAQRIAAVALVVHRPGP